MSAEQRTSAARPRVIERWFPCAEVSAASGSGWGSSNSETLLMSWFAKRPLAQSRAAVLCSLLPWPDDEVEQRRVQAIIREALGVCQDPGWYACRVDGCNTVNCDKKSHMSERGAQDPHAFGITNCARQDPNKGYDAARADVLRLLKSAYPNRPAETLDPFSGRGLIPIEAARYGQQAHATDYSPVAVLASRLLIDWPFRNWSSEPELPFEKPLGQSRILDPADSLRLIHDIEVVQTEVQRRIETELDEFYPDNEYGEKPWGYLWASVIPCDGCGREFPLYGSSVLRRLDARKGDSGCSFELRAGALQWSVKVVDGITSQLPTMRPRGSKRGKLAWCPFEGCGHAHEKAEHKRLVNGAFSHVEMLVVSDLVGTEKRFRVPTVEEHQAAASATEALRCLEVNGLPGRPNETIGLANTSTVRGLSYGAKTYGDLSVDRQNLLHAHIAKAIAGIANDIVDEGGSGAYASALAGYCAATVSRKLKRTTRGARLQVAGGSQVGDIFVNESAIAFNYDFFESGIGSGPGTWKSVAGIPSALALQCDTDGRPARVQRASALRLPFAAESLDAVVTDPPYEMMIDYSDASDLFYVWIRRALAGIDADFSMTAHPMGVQEKAEEIIVKKNYETKGADEHRTPAFYAAKIAAAFSECRRVVHQDGVVTIVFGHGEPEAWRALLNAVSAAGLVLTGAWPANTEKGGTAGSANINTTLTLACRPAPENRPDGRASDVDSEMRRVIFSRVRDVWGPSRLSYVDQKMAAAGPALEVVGRYKRILDKRGQPVDLARYLPLARQAVTEAHDLHFDSLPLETFDQKTRFALEWARAYGRKVQAASEARWQRLAADLQEDETAGVLKDADKGVRLITSKEAKVVPIENLPLFEVALAAAAGWKSGSLAHAATAIRTAGVDPADQHFWAAVNALSKSLPETDVDGAVWTAMVRNREALAAGIANAELAVRTVAAADARSIEYDERNPQLFDDPNSLFGKERS